MAGIKQRPGNQRKRKEALTGYLFTLPSFFGFIAFVLIPVFWALIISFQKYNVFTGASAWNGVKNYIHILQDARSVTTLGNTLWYAIFATVGNTAVGLLLAVAVDNKLPGRITVFFRSIYFFPSLIGLVFVAIIWQYFFQTDAGVINYYLGKVGISKIGWLSDKSMAKFSVLILDVWKNCGMSMLLILAGLQNIDRGLLEAAGIDGAGPVQKFLKMTLPLASPTIFFVLVMNVTGALRIYESVYVLTNGGPGDSSRSLVMLIAEKAFTSFDYGMASALSMILLILIGIITMIQFVGSRWWVHYD
ncbi:sugar ABC transporter permease [Hungatella hathewayi]|uniref:carbohydrate ABC transporter permease n=1 Tax=Hungatella hathewayi TaxID=154046 RepID=UPI00210F0430|nr:sugar ABC transporter permease [Hungatella hathewayi]MCQ5387966.1 sugar ABC transporter permease [Hungatella hathewayi]